ncbi:MAG: hypothetical protein HPY65_05050 [Syntrophaceae bacterium]|nr:hypothetical protein [Syntrophaceae bacterium]
MHISDWLDKEETKGVDVSQITLPDDMSYDEVPDETIFFKEINPCGILCPNKHPFSTVERFGRWYFCRGRNKEDSIHPSGIEWKFFTRNRDLAVKTAKSHIKNT